ncbi:hypothetical protein AAHH78_42065, partial [Burkholderia pseudomallei]
DFGHAQGGEEGAAPECCAQEPVGACPKCKGRVFELGMSYVCEHAVANPKTCEFGSGKVMLQQASTRALLATLRETGR